MKTLSLLFVLALNNALAQSPADAPVYIDPSAGQCTADFSAYYDNAQNGNPNNWYDYLYDLAGLNKDYDPCVVFITFSW